MKVGGVGNANYFILRNKSGQFSWGYIHPAILMKLMGMYYNSSSGDDSIYQSIAKQNLQMAVRFQLMELFDELVIQ